MTKKLELKNTYYALRHGQSEKNVLGLAISYPEAKDYHLTEKGRKQVSAAADWLKDKNIDLIISSDLTRTKDSADIVSRELNVKVIYDDKLRELDYGVYNNKLVDEYHGFFADNNDLEERFMKAPEGGETWTQVSQRMMEFLASMEQKHEDKTLLIVSHGDPLWLMQWASQCVSIDKLKDVSYPDTGEPFKLDVRCLPDGNNQETRNNNQIL